MATTDFKQVVANKLEDAYGSNSMTHRSAVVTKTATMANGSILKTDNTEAAVADAATATGIIADSRIDVASVGDVLMVAVVEKNAQVRASALKFSDADYNAEALTALVAAGIELV